MISTLPLAGIRVLDFTRVLAGPLCTMLLGDLGADVIKIEHPDYGDETRSWGPPYVGDPDNGISAYFACVNRNKRSLTLNLKSQNGQDIAHQLANQSHIVIENFKPGQMAQYQLDYDTLTKANPALVYCSITGFGQTGPYKDRAGYDFVIQGMSGLMSITGPVEDQGYKTGVAVSDVFTALYACNAIQAGLRQSEHTGQGQYIDVSLLESQLAALVNIGSNFLVSGKSPQRYGNQHANIVPYQVFDAQDGQFVLAVGNDRQFAKLCDLLGKREIAQDSRFSTNPARVENREALLALLIPMFKSDTVKHWLTEFEEVGIPAGPINTVDEALTDLHLRERDFIWNTQIEDTEVQLAGLPFHLSQQDMTVSQPPPTLGKHTNEILSELCGMSNNEISELKTQGIV